MKNESYIIYIAIVVNLFLSVLQIVFGFIGNSRAVVADGIHTFGYLFTNIMAAIGDQVSRRPANAKHPFGYGVFQYLTAVFIGVFVIFLGILIIVNIIVIEIRQPELIVLVIIAFSIACKQILSRFLRKKAHETENAIIDALAKEITSDGLSSIVVLCLVSLTLLSNFSHYFNYMDNVAGVIISLFIITTGIELISSNISNIIGQKDNNKERVKKLKELILKVDDVVEIFEIVLIKYGPYSNLYVKIKMKGTLSLRVINNRIKKIKRLIYRNDKKIKHINIDVQPK